MTTLVFAADVHVGNHKRFGGELSTGLNQRGVLTVAALRRATTRAEELEACDFLVLGDLFDDDRPNPQLIAAVQSTLDSSHAAVRCHVLVGNHDQTSDAEGHNALAPLRPVLNVVERPTLIERGRNVAIGLIPFRAAPASEYIPRDVAALRWPDVPHRILCVHAGVKDEGTPPWLRDSKDAIDVDELARLALDNGISFVATGNWHGHQVWRFDATARLVGTSLGEGRQERPGSPARRNAVLDLDGSDSERLRALHDREGAYPVSAHPRVRGSQRLDLAGASARPPMPDSDVREPGAPRAGDAAGEPVARRGVQRGQRAEDGLPDGPLARRRLPQQGGVAEVSNVRPREGAPEEGVLIMQIGSLCPTGFDDLTPEHGIAIWRDGDVSFEDVPGPRFAKVSGPDEFRAAIDRAAANDDLFVSFTVAPDELAEAQAVVELARQGELNLRGVEVLADGKALEAQARQAAEAARASSSLDEALSSYVEAMSLPEGVDRAEVLERARGYLK